MAETILLSPGILTRENDQSPTSQLPVSVGAAILGPTLKGPVELPTIVTSFNEFTTVFGGLVESGSNTYSYLTSISANNYFQNGGNSLLVTRVTSGSFTPATSSIIPNYYNTSASFVLETLSEGIIMNSGDTETSNGALTLGTQDNVRWEIATVNTSSGNFSLLIRRGNDTQTQKVVLESYNNISLDPHASNYISKVIGDSTDNLVNNGMDYYIQSSGSYSNISRFVRVKSVDYKTPLYFDNNGTAKDEFTGSLPIVSSGSFGSAVGSNIPSDRTANFYNQIDDTDTQGLVPEDYDNAISLLGNVDEFQFNVISAPGLVYSLQDHGSRLTSLVNNSISRGDSIAIIDLVPYGSQVNTVIQQSSAFDSSYVATYWPWLQTIDPNTSQLVFVPASTFIPGIFAYTDATGDPWLAPAGLTRGGLGQVTKAERKLTSGQKNDLYEANINPINTFPSQGIVVYGQKNLQKRATALDRIGVRRLLIELKSHIGQIANTLVFEQNTIATRNNFLTQVNPYLETVQQREGLYTFKVVMDETNNSPSTIDRLELIGQIFIQPTRTVEFIILDFNITPTGATFPV